MPIFTTRDTYGPAPVEGDPEGAWTGRGAAVGLAYEQSLGASALKSAFVRQEPGAWISHDDAARQMQEQGYATDGVPADGLTSGGLQILMDRQSNMHLYSSIAARANLGTVERFVAGLVGTAPDPVNTAAMMIAPELRLPAALRASRLARAGLGAAEGAAYGTAQTYGAQHFGHQLGDDDVSTAENLRTILFGAAVGGGLHVSFGGRAPVVTEARGGAPLSLAEISQLEATQQVAQARGIPESEVTSSKGAVGKYQVTGDTARTFGLDPTRLKEAAYNELAAKTVLDELQRRFPNDPEAQAIAYNAGPGRAERWIKAGRDNSTLPAETQGYLARLQTARGAQHIEPQGTISKQVDALPPQVRTAATETAVSQFAQDAPVNVEPILARLPDLPEQKPMFENLAPTLRDAIPRPDSILTEDPALAQRLRDMENIYGNQGRPNGPETEAEQHTKAAVEEAMQLGRNSPTLAGEMASEFAAHAEGTREAQGYVEAVKAAVRCGMMKGLA